MRKMTYDEKIFVKMVALILLVLALYYATLLATFQPCSSSPEIQFIIPDAPLKPRLGEGDL